jgi:hypothetical protein
MKKIIIVFLFLFMPALASAASSITWAESEYKGLHVLEIFATMDTDGSFTSITIPKFIGYLNQAETEPVSPPTSNYDITLTDKYGLDVFGTALTNRSSTSPEMVKPLLNGNDTGLFVCDPLTLAITGNTATNAQVYIRLFGVKF